MRTALAASNGLTQQTRPASHEASRSNRRRMSPDAGRWQVFGLTSMPADAGRLLPTASQRARTDIQNTRTEYQCLWWGSFSLTAAGQPWNYTRFPIEL